MKHKYLPLAFVLALSNVASGQMVQKCCGTGNSTFLLGNLSTSSHSQSIYTPGDLTDEASGGITTLYYRYGTTGITSGNTLTNFMVRLVQTTESSFAGGNTFFTGLDTVLTSASFTIDLGTSGEWFAIPLDSTFTYDAGLTLVVDISFTGSATTNFGTMSTSMAGRKLYWNDNTSPTGQSLVTSWQDIGFDLMISTGIAAQDVPTFTIYPNPATDRVEVLRNGKMHGAATLQLVDMAGGVVMQRQLSGGDAPEVVRTDGLSNGLYQLRIIDADGSMSSRRLVIAR